jgi:hypothetical protein
MKTNVLKTIINHQTKLLSVNFRHQNKHHYQKLVKQKKMKQRKIPLGGVRGLYMKTKDIHLLELLDQTTKL